MSKSLYEKFESQIKDYVKERGNTIFLVMVNYNIASLNSTDKSIYVRYNMSPECKSDPLEFGTRESINGRYSFIKNDDAKNSIIGRLMNKEILKVDLKFEEEDIELIFDYNLELQVLNICQSTFSTILDLIYTKDTKSDITLNRYDIPISLEIRNALYERLESHMMKAYQKVCRKKLYKFISRRKANIQFYYIFTVFRVVFIQDKCIYNPLLDCERNRRLFEQTQLYQECQRHTELYKGMKIYFATDETICKSFDINKGIKLNNIFLMQILFGLINDSFPNDRTVFYLSKLVANDALTEEQYLQLKPESRAEYARLTTLYDFCDRNHIRLGETSGASLYEKISKATLL